MRLAYYGKLLVGQAEEQVVFKEMISLANVADLERQRYMADLEMQTIASKLALDFNKQLKSTENNPGIKLKFLMAKVVAISSGLSTYRFVALEKRFRGVSPEMVKYTNNMDFVLSPEMLDQNGRTQLKLALAFSHFTHHVTKGYLLVCDLQGVSTANAKGKWTLLLTDPAIHCPSHCRFGKTNFQMLGIDKFFEKHACNEYCTALALSIPIKAKQK